MLNFFNRVMGDRRSAQRHDFRISFRYRIRNSALEHASLSENISEVGIFFETDQHIRIGTIVHVLLDMPHSVTGASQAPRLCTGHVVRIAPARAAAGEKLGVAVQFDCFESLANTESAVASAG